MRLLSCCELHVLRILLIVALVGSGRLSANESLFYFQTDSRYDYRTELLRLALSYDSDPPVNLIAKDDVPYQRSESMVRYGEIRGVLSLPTSKEREADFLPVKIPILDGILGMRVFLIRRNLQPALAEVDELSRLQQYSMGFGEYWQDLDILRVNHFDVITNARYEMLFNMLNAGRFDLFPRGVNEALVELQERRQRFPRLAIEETMAIYYPYPVYFFVNKQDTEMADRIHQGLIKAKEDGSFRKLFMKHHEGILKQLNFSDRKIFVLNNPTLPEDAATSPMSWWLDTSHLILPEL